MCGAVVPGRHSRHRTTSGKAGPCPPPGSRTASGSSKVPLGQTASKDGPSDAAQRASRQRHRGLASQPPLGKILLEGGVWVMVLQHPPRFAGSRGKCHSIWRSPVVRALLKFPKPTTRRIPLCQFTCSLPSVRLTFLNLYYMMSMFSLSSKFRVFF